MNISILSIGDEVLFGEIVDTNAAHIATRMYDEGLMVRRHLCVGDNEADIIGAIETLAGGNDVVIATGGLGPTVDDITARAAAKAAGRHLVLNEEALAHLKRFYARAGREMVPAAEKQCLLPAKAPLVPNPVGTACGFMLPHKGTYFFFMPGVPVEMKRILEETVIPAVRSLKKEQRHIQTRQFRVFGLSETQIEGRVKDVARPADGLSVAYCVNFPEVFVKLRVEGDDEARM
ncbi:MAG TPA: molybdopterin-binding protein, partial [Geobacteraceae bacterium]|nr:molybdopterin-binding protein [Geobacteraceae bacterium]